MEVSAPNGGGPSPVSSAAKSDASPVTVADYAAQAFITMRLAAQFPDDAFIAEESSAALRESPALLTKVTAAVQLALAAIGETEEVGPEDVLIAIDRAGSLGGDGRRTWM
jgi:3'-phosphoadenosine 5'-phosphosulfate (PAPS) 3'-phosphatase